MIFSWGLERSTRHATFVRRVRKYLEKKCGKADYELELVTGYRTDAFGYNRKSKIWYLCEIKVDPSDLKKAPQQILDTKFHFPKTPHYHKGDTIVPVIAIPARLATYLVKYDEWDSLRNTCKMVKAALWVIEQSTVREVVSPGAKKSVKPKSARTSASKGKTTLTKKTASKTRAAKTSRKTTARAKTTKFKKRVVKSSKTKKLKTQSAKRKTSKTRKSITKRKR